MKPEAPACVQNIQGGPKNRTISKSARLLYTMRQEGDLYIKMLSSLSGVKVTLGMSPYLNIPGTNLEKPTAPKTPINLRHENSDHF